MKTIHSELVLAGDVGTSKRKHKHVGTGRPSVDAAAQMLGDLLKVSDRVKSICLDLIPEEVYRIRCELALLDQAVSRVEHAVGLRREHDAEVRSRELEMVGFVEEKTASSRLSRSVALLLPPARRPQVTAPSGSEDSPGSTGVQGDGPDAAPAQSERRRKVAE